MILALKSGVFAAPSSTCKRSLGVASISEMFSKLGGGIGGGWGGRGGGGGGGGGGFEAPAAGDSALGTSGDDVSNSVTEGVIFLSVGVMHPSITSWCPLPPILSRTSCFQLIRHLFPLICAGYVLWRLFCIREKDIGSTGML